MQQGYLGLGSFAGRNPRGDLARAVTGAAATWLGLLAEGQVGC